MISKLKNTRAVFYALEAFLAFVIFCISGAADSVSLKMICAAMLIAFDLMFVFNYTISTLTKEIHRLECEERLRKEKQDVLRDKLD